MRCVSLAPSYTEILERLGGAQSLAGITDHCPAAGKAARLGAPNSIDLDALAALAPDVVFADPAVNRADHLREIHKKYRLFAKAAQTADAVPSLVRHVGELIKKKDEAGLLAASLEGAVAAFAKSPEPVSCVILLWDHPYMTVNAATYVSSLVETAGGLNVFGADPVHEFAIELEDVFEKQPQVLLLPTDPYPFGPAQKERLRQFPSLSGTRVELIDGRNFSRFGPRTAAALGELAPIFGPGIR